LIHCVYGSKVWFWLLRRAGFQQLCPGQDEDQCLADWWITCHNQVLRDCRKGFDCMVVLIAWHRWKERNARVFHNVRRSASILVAATKMEGQAWVAAGYTALVDFLQ
jgi:hypothetical protein